MTTEKLKIIDQANILHAGLVLFGHDLISKEKFIEIAAKVAENLTEEKI